MRDTEKRGLRRAASIGLPLLALLLTRSVAAQPGDAGDGGLDSAVDVTADVTSVDAVVTDVASETRADVPIDQAVGGTVDGTSSTPDVPVATVPDASAGDARTPETDAVVNVDAGDGGQRTDASDAGVGGRSDARLTLLDDDGGSCAMVSHHGRPAGVSLLALLAWALLWRGRLRRGRVAARVAGEGRHG